MSVVKVVLLDEAMPLPSYAHPGDAGADLAASHDVDIAPGQRVLVGTGIAVELSEGTVGFIHPRSGLAMRCGLTVLNAPGTIDAGYRGEIKVCLLNTDQHETVRIKRGDRIAQLVIQRFEHVNFVASDTLEQSARGAGGYGSTGGASALPQPEVNHATVDGAQTYNDRKHDE